MTDAFVLKLIERAASGHAFTGGQCFACGGDPTTGQGEHVVPRWTQRRFDLFNLSLLILLKKCHAGGCVHRDVKPENLIVVDEAAGTLALLDFGLSFHPIPEVEFQTEDWQEIGNRFLRLPELSAGSLLKQDPRSDISFAGGILFYILTGQHPNVLQDAEGKLPHQRSTAVALLQTVAGAKFGLLAALLDQAFAPHIADRFSDVDTMERAINNIVAPTQALGSPDVDLSAILQVIDTAAERRRVASIERFSAGLRVVQQIHESVSKELGGSLITSQSMWEVTGTHGSNRLTWMKAGSKDEVLVTRYEIREAGDELVVTMSGEQVYRTSLETPDYGDAFRSVVRAWILARVRAALSDPNTLPSEAEYFENLKPHSTLDAAAADALKTNRNILAFVYDPTMKERGRLRWALMYFLQNKKTRDALAGTFVLALIPLAQIKSRSDILDDQSMEQSRWVVLNPELRPLEQAIIVGNPQQAERVAEELSRKFRR